MRTTLNLADDVYESAKTLAEGSGKTLGEVISALARRAMRPQAVARGSSDGLPAFDVPDTADIIPGNRAHELLDDEGAE